MAFIHTSRAHNLPSKAKSICGLVVNKRDTKCSTEECEHCALKIGGAPWIYILIKANQFCVHFFWSTAASNFWHRSVLRIKSTILDLRLLKQKLQLCFIYLFCKKSFQHTKNSKCVLHKLKNRDLC